MSRCVLGALVAALVLAPAARGAPFRLLGTAADSADPKNPANEVISFDTGERGAVAAVTHRFARAVRVPDLDDQLSVDYLLVGRKCGGGSPRFQLRIDPDGRRGRLRAAWAYGYLGRTAFGGGCPLADWVFQDMTSPAIPVWDLSQFGGPLTDTWDAMELYFAALPAHRVLEASFVDDAASFYARGRGCAYFDLLSLGDRTLTSHADTAGTGARADRNRCDTASRRG